MGCNVVLAVVLVLVSSLTFAGSSAQEEINKNNVINFYNQVINNKDFQAAKSYLGNPYTQHNPLVKNGSQGLNDFIHFLREKYPQAHSEILRVFADGDFVILQVHSTRVPGTRGRAIFDLFKLKNGKIIEHWDVIQEIPAVSVNSNPMF